MTIRLFELVCDINARIHVVSLNTPNELVGKSLLQPGQCGLVIDHQSIGL